MVIVTDSRVRFTMLIWLSAFRRRDRIHVLSAQRARTWSKRGIRFQHRAARTPQDFSQALKFIGPPDVLVDARPGSMAEHERLFDALFYHVRRGGVYVIDRRLIGGPGSRAETRAWLQRVAKAAEQGGLIQAAELITESRRVIVFKQRFRHHLKLRDAEVAQVLAAREPEVRVTELVTLPAGDLRSKAEVVSHESGVPIPWLPARMAYPPLHARHYAAPRIAFVGRSLLYTEGCVLPESFRWHLEPSPRIPNIKTRSPLFVRMPGWTRPTETLPGDYFHIDPNYFGHFGHFMTESIGRLWAWDAVKERFPDLKVIYRLWNIGDARERFEHRILTAYGISDEDIVAVDRPVWLTSVVGATPMWHNAEPHYVHPGLAEVWDRISRNVVDPEAPTYDRVFISRSDTWWRRGCRNTRDVEQLFSAYGFEIVYPEYLDLGAQAAIFANASVIAGFAGSAMFNVMHAKRLETFIVLAHEAYTARNEHLYTSLLGGTVHYFWSPPDVAHPEGGWRQDAFDSAWEFDFARNQRPLEKLLGSL